MIKKALRWLMYAGIAIIVYEGILLLAIYTYLARANNYYDLALIELDAAEEYDRAGDKVLSDKWYQRANDNKATADRAGVTVRFLNSISLMEIITADEKR